MFRYLLLLMLCISFSFHVRSQDVTFSDEGIDYKESLFICASNIGDCLDLLPVEFENHATVSCTGYELLGENERSQADQTFCPDSDGIFIIDAIGVDENADVVVIKRYTIYVSDDDGLSKDFFESQFFLPVEVDYIRRVSLGGDRTEIDKSASPTIHDFSRAEIAFILDGSSSEAIDIGNLISQEAQNIDEYAKDEVNIYITDDITLCNSNDNNLNLKEIENAFRNPEGVVYWLHIKNQGDDDVMYVNSSHDNFGSVSFEAGTVNYFHASVNDFSTAEANELGYGSYSEAKTVLILDQFSGTVIAESQASGFKFSDLQFTDEYECGNIYDGSNPFIYLSPAGVPIMLSQAGLPIQHAPRFTAYHEKYGIFPTALTGFTLYDAQPNRNPRGNYSGHHRDGVFLYYKLRGAKVSDGLYQVSNTTDLAPYPVSLGLFKRGDGGCAEQYYNVNLLPNYSPLIVSTINGNGAFLTDVESTGIFADGIYSIANYKVANCSDADITQEGFDHVLNALWNPEGAELRPAEVGNNIEGWYFEVRNENGRIARIFATYNLPPGQISNRYDEAIYYKYNCDGSWDEITLERRESLDIYTALYFTMSSSTVVHGALDGIGMIPGFGEPADILNGYLYATEGDNVNAALSFAGALPFIGMTKVGRRLYLRFSVPNSSSVVRNGLPIVAVKVFRDQAGSIVKADFGRIFQHDAYIDLSDDVRNKLYTYLDNAPNSISPPSANYARTNWERMIKSLLVEGSDQVSMASKIRAFDLLSSRPNLGKDFGSVMKLARLLDDAEFVNKLDVVSNGRGFEAVLRSIANASKHNHRGLTPHSFMKFFDEHLDDLQQAVLKHSDVPGFQTLLQDLQHQLFTNQDGASHMLNYVSKQETGTIRRMEAKILDADSDALGDLADDALEKICTNCRFDVELATGKRVELKSYRESTIGRISSSSKFYQQFEAYVIALRGNNNLNFKNGIEYTFNAKKANFDRSIIDDQFRTVLANNGMNLFQRLGGEEFRRIFDIRTFSEFNSLINSDDFYDFIKLI